MGVKPIIIVPYRNREQHLAQFISHMQQRIDVNKICVVEQSGNAPFNRGKLLNIGFLENSGYSHYIFHDVDMLPINVPYLNYNTKPVLQLASSEIQLHDYLGGVTRFSNTAFRKAGGYHNDYYHRAEDNEMRFNLRRLDIAVINKFGTYNILDHERKEPEFNPALWRKAQLKRETHNQLSICKYETYSVRESENLKHMIVNC